MKIAVTYVNGQVFQHFGHTKEFKVYDCRDGRVESARVENAGDSGHEALADFLKALGVEALICGGIGAGANCDHHSHDHPHGEGSCGGHCHN